MRSDTLYCAWCPDTPAVWSRFLDSYICPACRGDDFIEQPEEESK